MKSLAVCSLLALLALPSAGLEPRLVKDIRTGPLDSDPSHLVTLGDAVLFFAFSEEDGTFGLDLWRSDGTAGGTWRLAEDAGERVRLTERLYFFRNHEGALWVTDGTSGGTFQLTPPGVLLDSQGFESPSLWVPGQGVLYFVAGDPDHGRELWRSDGTVAGTRRVEDIRPGAEGSAVERLTEYKGRVWFFADDGQHDFALWRTDGTAAATALEIDLPPLPPLTHVQPLHVVGGRLAFFAPNARGSLQLWAGDGTARGTALIRELTAVHQSTVRGNRLYFVGETRHGRNLWVSDGTRRGTRALTRFRHRGELSGITLQPHADLNGRILFWADDGVHGLEPWITDGTRGGTRLLQDICPGSCPGAGNVWDVLGGRLYFSATNPARGHELWSTDGRSARFVADICPGRCDSRPYGPRLFAGRFFFVAYNQDGEEVWTTDGTAEGTLRVTDFEPPFIWEEVGFHTAVLNGMLLFGAPDPEHGMELWAITP